MKKIIFILLLGMIVGLAACGDNEESSNEESSNESDELTALEVEFEVPEEAEVGETVELKAVVTFGDEDVTDAEEMNFEYWEKGDRDNSITVDSTNHEDGSYTAEVSFDRDGIFEMFAHTTARDQHTMPQKSIIVGDGAEMEYEEDEEEHEEDHDH